MYHLHTQHPAVFEMNAKEKSGQPLLLSVGIRPQHPCNEKRQEKITALLLGVIMTNVLPIFLVENAEFHKLMALLEPNYSVPARLPICKRLNITKVGLSKAVTDEM